MDEVSIGKRIKEIYPQYSGVDDAILGRKYLSKYGAAISGLKSGVLKMSDIPEAQRAGTSIGVSAEDIVAEKTVTEKKLENAYNAAQNLVDMLEQRFSEAKGGEYTGMGALVAGTKKDIAAALNLDKKARVYNKERRGFTAALKQVTGDVGVLTQKDYERIASLIPTFRDDPEVAKDLFIDLRQQMATAFGGTPGESKLMLPEVKGGLGEAVVPKITAAMKSAEERPWTVEEKLPTMAGPLPAIALSERYRKEIVPPALEEVLPAISIAGGIKSGIGKIVSPRSYLSKARGVAAEAVEGKISTKPVIEAMEKYVEKDPLAKSTAEKILPALKDKSLTVKEALERSQLWNQAYTAAGRVGKSEKAGLYNVMTKVMKEEIAKVAPEVAKKTAQLRATYTLPKIATKIGKVGAGLGTIGGGIFGLSQLRRIAQGGD